MKHSFIALCILAATFTVTLVACSKKDWLPNDQKPTTPVRSIFYSQKDSPIGKINSSSQIPVITESGIIILPSAKNDTPYGKPGNATHLPPMVEPGMEILPGAKSDTPYGKPNSPNQHPGTVKPGMEILPGAKSDTPYGNARIIVIKPLK
jgi:hypothetical protein